MTAPERLTLTARLNTSAVDSRRGVVRLHPSVIAALGIREWDAVSLTGSRTTTAVAGMASPNTPVGTVLLDDVTLSNAGLSENAAVIVVAATVYGARSVTLSGSTITTAALPPARLRQALLGKVLTVGDAVSLLPRDLGPGTSTSDATRALASAVGISWTSELLTVTGVDPAGPVSVQPNSSVTWGAGVPIASPPKTERPDVKASALTVSDLKGVSAQAAKLMSRTCCKASAPQRIWAFWYRGRPGSARRRWCAPSARPDGWSSWTVRRSARSHPKVACSGWPRR
jgi:transitional endoplasmic reticulum ATPase